ncbi:MAG: S-layer homology domain-containing protein [Oscillospiraceae bacterium]|nr:S-layer homology domain-containing protein [Oscillospiraceae bacterium]
MKSKKLTPKMLSVVLALAVFAGIAPATAPVASASSAPSPAGATPGAQAIADSVNTTYGSRPAYPGLTAAAEGNTVTITGELLDNQGRPGTGGVSIPMLTGGVTVVWRAISLGRVQVTGGGEGTFVIESGSMGSFSSGNVITDNPSFDLVMTGGTIEAVSHALYMCGDSNITITGGNLSSENGYVVHHAGMGSGKVTISGDARLSGRYAVIRSNYMDVEIYGGTMERCGADSGGTIHTIAASVLMTAGSITVDGGSGIVSPTYPSVGIEARDVEMRGGSITVSGNPAGHGAAQGIKLSGSLIMTGGAITVSGCEDNGSTYENYTAGIAGSNESSVTISGGEITANGISATMETSGVRCSSLIMTGGAVTATGPNSIGARLHRSGSYVTSVSRITGGTIRGVSYGIYAGNSRYAGYHYSMIIAYLTGTVSSGSSGSAAGCVNSDDPNGRERIVEISSLIIPSSWHGTSMGMTSRDGYAAPVWDLSGEASVIVFPGTSNDDRVMEWGADEFDIEATDVARIILDATVRRATVSGPGAPEPIQAGALLNCSASYDGHQILIMPLGDSLYFKIPEGMAPNPAITLTMYYAGTPSVSASLTLDDAYRGRVTAAFSEMGGVEGSAQSESPGTPFQVQFYDSSGALIATADSGSGGDYAKYFLDEGAYEMVFIRANTRTHAYRSLSALTRYLDSADIAYAQRSVTVRAGAISTVPNLTVPHVEGDVSMLDAGRSSFTARAGSSTISVYATLAPRNVTALEDSLGLRLSATYGSGSGNRVFSMSVNGQPVGAAPANGALMNIRPSDYGGWPLSVEYSISSESGENMMELGVTLATGSSSVTETLFALTGSSQARGAAVTMSNAGARGVTSQSSFDVSGYAYWDGSGEQPYEVLIYDNGELAGRTTIRGYNRRPYIGAWTARATLNSPLPGSHHELTVSVVGSTGRQTAVQPDSLAVTYVPGISTLLALKAGRIGETPTGANFHPISGGAPITLTNHNTTVMGFDGSMHDNNEIVFRAEFSPGAGFTDGVKLVVRYNNRTETIRMRPAPDDPNAYIAVCYFGNAYSHSLPRSFALSYDPIYPDLSLTQSNMDTFRALASETGQHWNSRIAAQSVPDQESDPQGWLAGYNRVLGLDRSDGRIIAVDDNSAGELADISLIFEINRSGVRRSFRITTTSGIQDTSAVGSRQSTFDSRLGSLTWSAWYTDSASNTLIKTSIPGGASYTQTIINSDSIEIVTLDTAARRLTIVRFEEVSGATAALSVRATDTPAVSALSNSAVSPGLAAAGAATTTLSGGPSGATWVNGVIDAINCIPMDAVPLLGSFVSVSSQIVGVHSNTQDIIALSRLSTEVALSKLTQEQKQDCFNRIDRARNATNYAYNQNSLFNLAGLILGAFPGGKPAVDAFKNSYNVGSAVGSFGTSTFSDRIQRETIEYIRNLLNSVRDNDPDDDSTDESPIDFYLDPSGYVYEAVPSNRLEGVTATIWFRDDSGNRVLWDDYYELQENPLTTDAMGDYGWDVPEGNWLVTWSKAGYEDADSALDPAAQVNALNVPGWSPGWLPVPPPQMDVNIGMVSLAAPVVASIEANTARVTVTFSKYMDVRSLDGVFSVALSGNRIPFTVSPFDAEEDPAQPGCMLARVFILTGEFPEGAELTLGVSAAASSYAGTSMGAAYVATAVVSPAQKVQTPTLAEYRSDNAASFGFILSCATDGASIWYTLDGSDDWILYAGGALQPLAGTWTLMAKAVRPGWVDSEVLTRQVTMNEITPMFPEARAPSWNVYSDVRESHWFYEAVRFVTENDLMNGVGSGVFAPNSTMTRAMLVTVLYRLEGSPSAALGSAPQIPHFYDAAANQWYTDAILWAAGNGIVDGYGDGRFGTNDPVTREQAVVILHRYAIAKGLDVSAAADLSGFADAGAASSWAREALGWAIAAGIIQGRSGNTAAPRDTSTRAELATILKRYVEL